MLNLNNTCRPLVTVLVLGALMGCAKGPLQGQLTKPGQPPQIVMVNYESSVFGGSGKLWTSLPDGETYKGKYILTPYSTEHHMISDLEGDRGGSMVCKFKLNEPGVGPDGGGTGKCDVSKGGGIINLKF